MNIARHTDKYLKDRIIFDNGETLSFIATIDAVRQYREHVLFIVRDINVPEDLNEGHKDIVVWENHIPYTNPILRTNVVFNEFGTGISTSNESDSEFVNHVIDAEGVTIITMEDDARVTKLARFAEVLGNLFDKKPIYKTIVHNDELVSLADIILMSDDKDKYINQILFAAGNTRQLIEVAERVLTNFTPEKNYNLITGEEQVSMFLELTKKSAENVEELVSDEFINRMKNHESYKIITTKLQENGFRLSETQQFNSLQHTGLLLNSDKNVLYNLSDMGAGKTLMTTQAIMMSQYVTAIQTAAQLKGENTSNLNAIILPSINIIAPTLSLKSSWLQTFNIFVETNKVSDSTYTYEINQDGYVFTGRINFSGFTVRRGAVHVNTMLPTATSKRDFLVIDEIHQLINKKIKADKFITKQVGTKLNINDTYKTFVLSGTLANLTVDQWFNMVELLSIPNASWGATTRISSAFAVYTESAEERLQINLSKMADHLAAEQNREFDPSFVSANLCEITQPKMTQKEIYFNTRYGTNLLNFGKETNNDLNHNLTKKNYEIVSNPTVLSTPNFELFYKLVSSTVVTAQSIQIAEELFGEQATQNKAQVIKTSSPLTTKDVNLLKRLHKIVKDVHIYKSQVIATDIANAILNLNDGLQTKTIYDILNKAAAKSVNFLSYLTKMDLSLLEDIQSSNLITTPKLEETEKFKIVKDILEKEKEETFLIVVNTPESAITMSNALNIKHLTEKQMSNELDYQDVINELYTKQNIVIVPQFMIKSSLDLVQVNRLVQYQLNTEVSDIIQTQNRINRIGQTRETKAYYIATDVLQENIIELFLEAYRNIKVAHKGIVELFVDMEQQIDVVSDYLANALETIDA